MERFWARVEIRGERECWEWIGRRYKRKNANYGAFDHDGRCSRAHRFAYQLVHRVKLTASQYVLHSCDNPPCVNPNHLYLGTQADNVRDCVMRGRASERRGAANPNCRLTPEEVGAIRRLRNSGWTLREIARLFGVSHPQIGHIVRREQWK